MTLINEKLNFLMKRKGIRTKALSRATGISYTTLLDIVNGKTYKLDITKGIALANALDCKTEYLVDDSITLDKLTELLNVTEKEVLTQKDKTDIYKELLSMQEQLMNSEGLLFDGEPATKEAVDSIISALSVGMEMAKRKNKEKYTPNKYK